MATTKQQQQLSQGSKGSDVSAIQQALKNYGFYTGVVDGLFGPKTSEAVKNFQNMTGIKVDAIVGPQTQGKIQEWGANPGLIMKNDPIVKELAKTNPSVQSVLNSGGNILDTVGAAYELGKKGVFPSLNGTQQDLNNFYEISKQYLSPEFNQNMEYFKADFLSGLEKEKADYESALKDQQDKIYSERNNLYDNLAKSGTWLGSEAGKQREMFTDSANRSLADIERKTSYKLSDLARTFENKAGTQDVNRFDFSISQPGSVNSIGKYQAGSGTKNAYTPIGNQSGTLRNAYNAQVGQLGNQMWSNSKPRL